MLKNSLPFWFLIFWFKTSFVFPLPQRFFALSQVFWHFTCALVWPCFHPFVLEILGLFHSANSCPSVLKKWSWNNSGIISYPQFSLFSHSSTTVIFNWTSWTSPLTFSTGCSSFPFFSLSLSLSFSPSPLHSCSFSFSAFWYIWSTFIFFVGRGTVPLNVPLPFYYGGNTFPSVPKDIDDRFFCVLFEVFPLSIF